jgi:hypothetical protein
LRKFLPYGQKYKLKNIFRAAKGTNLKIFAVWPEVQTQNFCRMARSTNPNYLVELA